MPARNKTIGFYLLAAGMIATLLLFQQVFSQLSFVEEEITTLQPLQEKQLELFVDMNKQLMTLATLVLGGIGAIVFNRYEHKTIPRCQLWNAIGAWVFCGLSLYCGVLINEKLIWMLHGGFFNLTNPQIISVYRLQFWTLVFAAILVARFFHAGLSAKPAAQQGST